MTGDSSNDADFEQLGIRNCAPLPAGMPQQWLGHKVRVGVGLILTGSNCVSQAFFESFAVTSVDQAIQRIIAAEDVNLQYTFAAESAFPLFAYDADWPLLRRSKETQRLTPRVKVQGAEPWTWQWDRTLFEIYRKPFDDDPLSGSSRWGGRLYLRVGGRSEAQTAEDWRRCAKVLRAIYRLARAAGDA